MGSFDYDRDFENINFREHPEKYQIGNGEQGVFVVEPYKSELLPHWRFKNKEVARTSAKKIYQKFQEYKQAEDFVGMDMARKFLQMGYTRARRYANYNGGKKYEKNPQEADTQEEAERRKDTTKAMREDRFSNEKAKAADVFYSYYEKVKEDTMYQEKKHTHRQKYE